MSGLEMVTGVGGRGVGTRASVGPGVLASHVTPENTREARELAREIEKLRADVATVMGLLSEIRSGVAGFDTRVPRNLSALADALLAGSPPPDPEKPSTPGTAGLSRSELETRRTALELRRKELERAITDRSHELKSAVTEILRNATMNAESDLADLVREQVAALHVAVDAAYSLQPRISKEPLPDGWRQEKFLASPMMAREKTTRDDPWSSPMIVDFSSGGGIPGEVEGFRRAVKELVGVCPL